LKSNPTKERSKTPNPTNSNMDRDNKWSMMDKGYLPLDWFLFHDNMIHPPHMIFFTVSITQSSVKCILSGFLSLLDFFFQLWFFLLYAWNFPTTSINASSSTSFYLNNFLFFEWHFISTTVFCPSLPLFNDTHPDTKILGVLVEVYKGKIYESVVFWNNLCFVLSLF
jgi:hypothetical protein